MKEERIIRNFIIKFLLIILALIIQLIIPPLFAAGIKPDILLAIVIILGLIDGKKTGTGFGFLAGMMQDLFMGGIFGIYTLVKAICGGTVGFLERIIFKEKIVIVFIIIFFTTYIHELLVILLSEQILNVNLIFVSKSIILPAALINSIIGSVIYYIYYKLTSSGGDYYG